MSLRSRRVTSLIAAGCLGVGGALFAAAPAQAAEILVVSVTVAIDGTQVPVSGDPAEPTNVPVGSPTIAVTLENPSADEFTLTGLTALPTSACDTTVIAAGASAVCTGPITIGPGATTQVFEATGSFATDPTAIGPQGSVSASVFGVSYDLRTLLSADLPTGGSAPSGDPRTLSLPLGYFPTLHLGFVNGSNVGLTGFAPTGFATGCPAPPTAMAPGETFPESGCRFSAPTPVVSGSTAITVGATSTGAFGEPVETSATLHYGSADGECSAGVQTIGQGERLTINCFGFLPGIDVVASLSGSPVSLGVRNTGATGDFSFGFVVPPTLAPGAHSVALALGPTVLTQTDPFAVRATLAATGVDPRPLLVVAGSTILLGGALVVVGIRRRSARHR